MSIFMRATVVAMTMIQKISSATGSRNPLESLTKPKKTAEIPNDVYEKYGAYFRTVNGATVIRLDPETDNHDNELIYIYGGSYTRPMTRMHWGIVDRLVQATLSAALIPQYLLAPNNTAADAYSFFDQVYTLAEERAGRTGGKIIIAGDSAGAGMALAYTMNRRDRGLSLPSQLLLFSPWLDATLENSEISSIRDPMLNRNELVKAASQWAGNWDIRDPRISPAFGSLENLPPVQIYQGTQDILYPDVRAFARRAAGAQAPVKLTVAPTGFHAYVALPHLPESRRAYREISRLFTQGKHR